MVEDERQTGDPGRCLSRGGQLARRDDEVVSEPRLRDGGQSAPYVGAEQPLGVGLLLDLVADADETVSARPLAQGGERVGDARRGEVDPADDSRDQVAAGREGQQLGRLLGDADGLYEDGAGHARRPRLRREVVHREAAGQWGEVVAGDPGLRSHRQVPDVVMGVDDLPGRHSRHTTGSPASAPAEE